MWQYWWDHDDNVVTFFVWNDFRSVLLPNRNAIFSIYGKFLYFRKTFVWKNFMTRKAKPPGNLKVPEVVGLCAWLCGDHDSSKVKNFAGCFRNFMTFVSLLQQLCSQDKVIRFRANKTKKQLFNSSNSIPKHWMFVSEIDSNHTESNTLWDHTYLQSPYKGDHPHSGRVSAPKRATWPKMSVPLTPQTKVSVQFRSIERLL